MQSQTRIGMITPSLNTVLEPVTYALLSDLPDVTAHFSRVRVTHISLGDDATSQFADEPHARCRAHAGGRPRPRHLLERHRRQLARP